jgi:4-amino-4-deoxy-L-arabinose transferase-like glycosyltransferase
MMTTTTHEAVARPPGTAAAQPRVISLAGLATLPWHRLGLGAVLALAALLNLWALDRIGYANTYYAAAIKSMLQNWHNFFFVSFDPGGFVSIDKPPLGFWIQTASAKLFGFSGFSILLPEAVAGVLSVAVLYRLVARVWGRGAGLLAALFLALTPVSVVTSRNNTIDSLLVLALLLAAWAVMRAVETGRPRWLLLGAMLVGLGFNIKMLEAYLVVPALGLVYLVGARTGWWRRVGHLALAALVMVSVSLSWALAVDLTPASARPYVGSSGTNSELNLALGYNGLQRLTGMLFGRSGGGTPGGGGTGGGNALFNGGPAGVFRLMGTTLGGQVSWLLVLAVLGLVLAATLVPWRKLDGRGRSLVLWGAWLLTAGAFFSVAEFFHPYYTVTLAPAIAALAAIGVTALWRAYRSGSPRGWLLPAVLLASAGAEAYILRDYPDWSRWLTPLVAAAGLLGALVLVALRLRGRRMMRIAVLATGLAVGSLLVAPTTWAAYSIANGTNATIPTAGPSAQTSDRFAGRFSSGSGTPNGFGSGSSSGSSGTNGGFGSGSSSGGPPSGSAGGFGAPPGGFNGGTGRFGGGSGSARNADRNQIDAALIRYLEQHQGSTRYLVATASSMSASSIIISTGKPVMALGGFSGSDQILTTAQLARLVANNVVHYFLVQSGGFGGGGQGGNSALMQWVTTHGTAVPSSQYQISSAGGFGQATLYYVSSSAAGGA